MKLEKAFAKVDQAEIEALAALPAPSELEIVISPIPATALPIEQALALMGRPTPAGLWKYHDADGNLLFGVARWNDQYGNKKTFLPISWVRAADGKEGFAFKHHPAPRPLYGLTDLLARPNAPVVVVEGEKCVDAARAVFPYSAVVTSSGGSNAALQTDWRPLVGRTRVLIWPDADDPGSKYATTVASILSDFGIPEILIVDAQQIAEKDPAGNKREFEQDWDVAKAIEQGHTPEALRAAAVAAAQPYKAAPRYISFGGYTMSHDGLVLKKSGKGEDTNPEVVWICSPFEIIGRARDSNGRDWARWLRFVDDDGREHLLPVKDADLHGDARALCAGLAARGLRISTGFRAHLLDYLNRARVDRRITIVSRTGWHVVGDMSVFVLPSGTIGSAGRETVVLDSQAASSYESRGTLEE
jgi:putative DNA primase/helicase